LKVIVNSARPPGPAVERACYLAAPPVSKPKPSLVVVLFVLAVLCVAATAIIALRDMR
jgi:hypothetical protein